MKTKLPSNEEMLAFVHADRVLLEVAINVIILDRDQRFQAGDTFLDAFVDIEEQLSGIIFDEIKQRFGVSDDNEPFEVAMQLFFAHQIFSVTRKQHCAPPATFCFMSALPFSFPGSLKAYVEADYLKYRLDGVIRANHFPYHLKVSIHQDILDGHPLASELYSFLSGYAFQEHLKNN